MRIYISNTSHGGLSEGQSEISFDAPHVEVFSAYSNKELAEALRNIANFIESEGRIVKHSI